MNTNIIKKHRGTATDIAAKTLMIIVFVVLAVYCISLLFPLVWMSYTSLKTEIDYTLSPIGLPKVLAFENFAKVITMLKSEVVINGKLVTVNMGGMFFNSILWAFVNSLFGVLVQAHVAYVMAKFNFFGKKFLYNLGIFIMMIPIVGNLPSGLLLRKSLGIYNNIYLMILTGPNVVFSGMHFLILYGMFKSLSWSYAEAAYIDGAGDYYVMWKIMMPMGMSTFTVLFMLQSLALWNDFESILIWLPSYPTLAYGMYRFQHYSTAGAEGATVPQILAGFLIMILPTSFIYLLSMKPILSKLTVGGLKE